MHSSSAARITSCTPRSISYGPKRVTRSSRVRWRALRHSDWELEALTLDGTNKGETSIMECVCLLGRMSEGHQTLLPCDSSTLSAVKFQLSGKELVL
jgi:hypothetical protein